MFETYFKRDYNFSDIEKEIQGRIVFDIDVKEPNPAGCIEEERIGKKVLRLWREGYSKVFGSNNP